MSTAASTWLAISAAIGNHLWQSTLFLGGASLLTIVFRKNHARVRYWMWLAASLKFLVPFSWLIALGSRLAWSRPLENSQTFFVALNSLGRPFSPASATVMVYSGPQLGIHTFVDLIPAFLAIWLCGSVFMLAFWFRRWRQIARIVRAAEPLREGREAEALQFLSRTLGSSVRVRLHLTNASLEPGIFGLFRAVLVWPRAISSHLNDSHLRAIVAHELCHARRRDNLTAALHTIAESLFWFHPLIWWLGARLIEERELACDEEVVEFGTNRRVYAESILKICEFCTSPPLACVAGVTGADLKRRISRIMKEESMKKLDSARKLLLATLATGVLAFPFVLGLTSTTRTRAASRAEDVAQASFTFESVSIKLNEAGTEALKSGKGANLYRTMLGNSSGVTMTNTPLRQLIQGAYELQDDRVYGGPEWLSTDLYDINAKIDNATAAKLKELSEDQRSFARRRMLQSLLADRFQLRVHRDTKELPVFALLVAEGGPKLKEATPGNAYSNGIKGPDGKPAGPGMMGGGPSAEGVSSLTAQAVSMSTFVRRLSWQSGRTVLDMTGLRGNYDFTLQWKPDSSSAGGASGADAAILATIQQLGLKLEPQKALMEVLVIDHAEQPKEN